MKDLGNAKHILGMRITRIGVTDVFCWPVKGLRTSGEGEPNMYILKLLVGLLFGGTDSV